MDASARQFGHVSASVARMQAKAAQLTEELRVAQAQASNHASSAAALLERCEGSPAVAPATADACNDTSSHQGGTPPTPAVFRRLSHASLTASKPTGTSSAETHQAVALQCQKLEAEVQLWKCKHSEAVKELDRRQDSYMRREEQLKARLAAVTQPPDTEEGGSGSSSSCGAAGASSSCHLAEQGRDIHVQSSSKGVAAEAGGAELSAPSTAGQKGPKGQKPLTLEEMQQQVLGGLDDLLQRQRLQMRTEEAQQLRAFRSRLAEIEGQLQAYKQAAAGHQGDWMDKTVALREELARTQEIASKLDAMYKLQEEEAGQLGVQFKAQEDDRQHLIRQLLAAKRDNTRLKQEQSALQEELDAIMALALEASTTEPQHAQDSSQPTSLLGMLEGHAAGTGTSGSSLAAAIVSRRSSSAAAGGSDPAAVSAKMQRYGNVIQKLQKLLESERRQLRQLRSSYTAELSRRNELQTLLLSSIQQAKKQHREAEAGYLAQHRQPAQDALPPWFSSINSSSSIDRPRSAARPSSARPGSAAAGSSISSSRQASLSRPTSAVPGAGGSPAGLSSEEQLLDQGAWDNLLNDLLARQAVLELLFGKAFPELVAGSEEHQSSWQSQLMQQQGEPYQQQGQQMGQLPVVEEASCGDSVCNEMNGPSTGDDDSVCSDASHDSSGSGEAHNSPQQQLERQVQEEHTHSIYSAAEACGSGVCCSSDDDTAADEYLAGQVRDPISGGEAGTHAALQQDWQQQVVNVQQPPDVRRAGRPGAGPPVALASLSGPVMPSFPARQQLHRTPLHRPRSSMVQQHQAGGAAAVACNSRWPCSAAAGSSSAAARPSSQGRARPISAAGSFSFSGHATQLDCGGRPLLGKHKQACPVGDASADTSGQRRAGSSSCRPVSAAPSTTAVPDRPSSAGISRGWGTSDADALMASFLSCSR